MLTDQEADEARVSAPATSSDRGASESVSTDN